ncbi:MAG: YceD family protein [Thermoleophilaceae bacterium]
MARWADSFELGGLGMTAGEARSVELGVPIDDLRLGGQTYSAREGAEVRLDLSRTMSGHALRLRFAGALRGPCMRCLEDVGATVDVDAREIEQPGDGEELRSPYVEGGEVDLRGWAREALTLALPTQIVCRQDCRGLCATCGANLNEDPGHAHEAEPDPRWAKLSELKLD